jgi:hypothetical protein
LRCRSDAFVATFTKARHPPEQVMVRTKMSGGGAAGMAGNVLIGVVVDASTGAGLDHDPNPVIARLKPLESVSPLIERRRPRRAAPVS